MDPTSRPTFYYWETENFTGAFVCYSDSEAMNHMRELLHSKPHMLPLLCVYKENDTQDGTPFIMVWEKPPKEELTSS